MTTIEIANWTALYLATALCCAVASMLSIGMLGAQLFREQPWRRIDGVGSAVLFVPQTWWRWQRLYLTSTPVTLGIVALFAWTLHWR